MAQQVRHGARVVLCERWGAYGREGEIGDMTKVWQEGGIPLARASKELDEWRNRCLLA